MDSVKLKDILGEKSKKGLPLQQDDDPKHTKLSREGFQAFPKSISILACRDTCQRGCFRSPYSTLQHITPYFSEGLNLI